MRRSRRWIGWTIATAMLASGCAPATPTTSPTGLVASAPATVASPTSSASPATGTACTPSVTPAAEDWNARVWYEAFVRSFADGDGDGIGDLRGMTGRLDYLNDGDPATTTDLGVTGMWLMPIAESPSYHGYDVVDYEAVERDYGTREDLDAFLAAAHERGIKVIVDLVMNHSSIEHPWFRDSAGGGAAHDDWYVWEDANPKYLGPGGQVVWHELDGRWYYAVFWEGMPDLNLRSAEVTAELDRIARFWLEDVGVDGFRIDAAKHLIEDGEDAQVNTPETMAWLTGWKARLDADTPDAMIVAEVWDPPTVASSYVPESADLTFDFGLATGIRLALQNRRAAPLVTAVGESIDAWPANRNASFLTNHDQPRIMTELGGDVAAAKLAAFLLLSAPGTPFLYYGEEIGLTGTKPDERIRTPMPWTGEAPAAGFTTGTPWEPLQDGWESVNVAAQADDPASLLATYRDLIRARGLSKALQHGGAIPVDGGAEPVTGWLRTTADETLLAFVNVDDEPVAQYGLTLDGGPLCGPMTARVVATVGGDPGATPTAPAVTVEGGLDGYVPFATLPPRGGYVLALEPGP